MDDQLLKVLMWIAGAIFTIFNVLIGFIMKRLWANVDRNHEELQELRLIMSERHPTKEEFKEFSRDIRRDMELGFRELKETLASNHTQLRESIISIFGKLENKADRKP